MLYSGKGILMSKEFKIIQDPLNGPIKVTADFQRLIDTCEFQRLRYIRQLGMCHLVFPGANHTRFEHSLGTMHLANMFSDALHLEDQKLLMASALLHDIGHPPLSHSLEELFEKFSGMDHLQAGISMILGKGKYDGSLIPSILESIGISPGDVVSVLLGNKKEFRTLSRMISGPVDVDELDYLRRDSMYCGVAIGNIDYRRIINVAIEHDRDIVIEEKGLGTLESVLIARILMYDSVYFHKTARIAQTMVKYVVESHPEFFSDPFVMNDNHLYSILGNLKEDRIARSVLNRELYKPVLRIPYSTEAVEKIKNMLTDVAGLDRTDYIIDVIPPLEFSGPDRIKSDLRMLKDGKLTGITEASPLIRTLKETLENKVIVVSSSRWSYEKVKELVRSTK